LKNAHLCTGGEVPWLPSAGTYRVTGGFQPVTTFTMLLNAGLPKSMMGAAVGKPVLFERESIKTAPLGLG